LMERKPEMTIQIIGHTDNVGNNEANLQLSKDRAASVKKYIIAKGIAAKRIETDGKGAYEPIADNNTEKGKAQNRRTEIRVKE
jgi:outer membrane protein OmpA-like peptidoglycan-associated protein